MRVPESHDPVVLVCALLCHSPAVNICFDAEYCVKSGRLNQDGVLEAVMLKLLNIRTTH